MGIILFIFGLLLILTGIGAIIGIPMIIIGIILITKKSKKKETVDYEKEIYKEDEEYLKEIEFEEKDDDDGNKENNIIEEEIKVEKIKPKKTKNHETSIEENIGMKWFSRIGILALVIGIGFFIKYAIDMNWINHLTRIILATTLGIGLIIFGEIVSKKEKYKIWAKTLIGGGFAITYFSIYASYHFQEYRDAIRISQELNIILLILVVFFAILFSIKDNSQIIAAQSFFLGYITSLLSNNLEFITIVYTLLLTIGLVSIVSYKKWSLIGIGGIFASYFLYFLWTTNNNSFIYSSFMLITFFIAFSIQIFFLVRKKEIFDLNIFMILVNSSLFFILYYFEINKYHPDYIGLFPLIMSIFYFIAYSYLKYLNEEKFAIANLYIALFFFTITIPLLLYSELITIFWAFEALLLTIMFFKYKINALKITSYVVGIITVIKTIFYDLFKFHFFGDSIYKTAINPVLLISFLTTILCFYLIYYLLKKKQELLTKDELVIPKIYSWIACIFLLIIIFIELSKINTALISGILIVLSILYVLISKINIKEILYQGFFISVILFIKILFFDSWKLNSFNAFNFFSSTKFFVFIFTIIIFYLIFFYLKHNIKKLNNDEHFISVLYSYGAIILTFIYILIEITPFFVTISLNILILFLLFIAYYLKDNNMKIQGLIISIFLFFKVLLYDSQYLNSFNAFDFFSSTRFFAFITTIIVFYIIYLFLENKNELTNTEKTISIIYSYVALFLLFILIIIEMKAFWITITLNLLFLLLLFIAYKRNNINFKIQGLIISGIVFLKVLIYDSYYLNPFNAFDFFSSTKFFAFITTIIVFYIVYWFLENKNELTNTEKIVSLIYSYTAIFLAFILIIIEMKEFWISVWWSILALTVIIVGFALRKKHLRIQGLIIFAVTIFKVFLIDINNLEPIYRTISYIVLGIILLTVSFIYTKYKDKLKEIIH